MLRKLLFFFVFLFLAMPLLRTAEVAIIYGEDSLRNKKEVSFVARRAKGMSRHLQRVGLTAEVFSDKNFKDAFSNDCNGFYLY